MVAILRKSAGPVLHLCYQQETLNSTCCEVIPSFSFRKQIILRHSTFILCRFFLARVPGARLKPPTALATNVYKAKILARLEQEVYDRISFRSLHILAGAPHTALDAASQNIDTVLFQLKSWQWALVHSHAWPVRQTNKGSFVHLKWHNCTHQRFGRLLWASWASLKMLPRHWNRSSSLGPQSSFRSVFSRSLALPICLMQANLSCELQISPQHGSHSRREEFGMALVWKDPSNS